MSAALWRSFFSSGNSVDSRSDQRLQAVGNAVQASAVAQRVRDLFQEERVSLCPFEHEAALDPRHVGPAQQRTRKFLALVVAERKKIDCTRVPDPAAPCGTGVEQLGPCDRNDQDGRVLKRACELFDEFEQRFLRPVDVFEDEHERLSLGELFRPPQCRPAELTGCAVSFRGAEDAERGGQQVGDCLALARGAQLLERVRRRVVVADRGARLDHRRERPVRDALAVWERSSR